MPGSFISAILVCCGLLAVGLLLRANLRLFKVLYIPASVIAGVIGFGVVQASQYWGMGDAFAGRVTTELNTWPKWLITIVFAGLLLERSSQKSLGESLRRGARSGILAWIIILGQIVIGLTVYVLMVQPFHTDVPASFGQLLEVSWAGGHGTATAMGVVYNNLGFPEGKDLAFFLATVGLIYGVLSGLVMVNLAMRRGWTSGGRRDGRVEAITGLEPRRRPVANAFARSRGEVIEPFALQVLILAGAFAVGFGYQQAFVALSGLVVSADTMRFLSNIPLFLFTLLGGATVRRIMTVFKIDDLIDTPSIQRMVGVSMEFLIVAAIVTLRVEALTTFLWPVLLLLLGAMAWSVFTLLVLAPRLLPRAYWFELGLLNFGFSTANTPQGLMLLRIIDPDLKSGAAEDYALAAPLSAPFVGGGVITVAVLPLLLTWTPAWLVGITILPIMFALLLAGLRLSRSDKMNQSAEREVVPTNAPT